MTWEPWAKLTTLATPNTRAKPRATMAYTLPMARPLMSCSISTTMMRGRQRLHDELERAVFYFEPSDGLIDIPIFVKDHLAGRAAHLGIKELFTQGLAAV